MHMRNGVKTEAFYIGTIVETNLAVGSQMAITKILADQNLMVSYGIAIRTVTDNKKLTF